MSTTATTRNGVDTGQLFGTLDAIKDDPSLAHFQFRARNRWIEGAHNRTTIRDFYAANQEDTTRAAEFVIDAGEPAILLGPDTGPNPAEHLLHALAACSACRTTTATASSRSVRRSASRATHRRRSCARSWPAPSCDPPSSTWSQTASPSPWT